MAKELVKQGTGEIAQAAGLDIGSGSELQVAPAVANSLAEVQAAMMLAKRYPRVYEECWGKLMAACKRETLAKVGSFKFPRGGITVTGPSVYLARVAAQCYGNIRYGLDVLRDDEDSVLIHGWAWDIENNLKATADDQFKKLIQRKKDGSTIWIKPDERDLRELINKRGAILKRNCLLEILPRDYIEDAQGMCVVTLRDKITDPKGEAKVLILEFQKYGVTVKMLNEHLGHEEWGVDDVIALREILNSLKDGGGKRDDFFGAEKVQPAESNGLSTDDMKPGDSSKHQGYEDQGKKKPPKDGQMEAGF